VTTARLEDAGTRTRLPSRAGQGGRGADRRRFSAVAERAFHGRTDGNAEQHG
jgi:hypothetical protein